MTLNQFVIANGLKQADAIILRKKLLGMVDHYAIFLGYRNFTPVFVANYNNGVKEVTSDEMNAVLQIYQPTQIDRFPGSEQERYFAIQRAWSRVGERAYDYVKNNCEHFKNWVHHGENRSEQVRIVGHISLGLAGVAALAAISTKNGKLVLLGLILLIIGVFLLKAAQPEKQKPDA